MENRELELKTYAGVLGKIIGVFYGRPIEGWPYEKIRRRFGLVDHFVHKEAGTPLIVADDDVAGTFTFLNAVEDCRDVEKLTARDFGEMWLDYIIENKTIFWWGGLGRSTEHTAYLRLKEGIKAPESGSIHTNGTAVAEQIGAQIFMDALAMTCPGDPKGAMDLVRKSASVSHDGIAVEAACFLAAMEALAFQIRDLEELLDAAVKLCSSEKLKKIIQDVRRECAAETDFRKVRDWLERDYGYDLYPGNCHVIPNFALILASLILGGDDFYKAMEICISCGWDTDCNGANLGCINGIRLGLEEINRRYDFRGPIADRLYNISAEGGECVSDAVIQTRRILKAQDKRSRQAERKRRHRFAFEYPGSVQGFEVCPFLEGEGKPLRNASEFGKGAGLLIRTESGRKAVSTPTMFDPRDRQENYCLTASPTLYETQTVRLQIEPDEGTSKAELYVAWYDFDNRIQISKSPGYALKGLQDISWQIPKTQGMPIARIGVLLYGEGGEASAILRSLDWQEAPEKFCIQGSLRNYEIGVNMALESFVFSAKQFHFDARASFTVSHTEKDGVATIGTKEWKDYQVSSILEPSIHDRFGLVGRSRGHRRYYSLLLWGGKWAGLFVRTGEQEQCLAKASFPYQQNGRYRLCLSMSGSKITGCVDDLVLEAQDDTYRAGGAGFLVDRGTALAYGFEVERIKTGRCQNV